MASAASGKPEGGVIMTREEAIVMDGRGPGLYIPCDDWYYSKIVMNVNFCPVCGRQVNPNYKAQR